MKKKHPALMVSNIQQYKIMTCSGTMSQAVTEQVSQDVTLVLSQLLTCDMGGSSLRGACVL